MKFHRTQMRGQRRTLLASALAAAVLSTAVTSVSLLAGGSAMAQGAYPNKPIRIVVPYPAGGSTDVLARLLGTHLTNAWGQPVVVDNKAGAGGAIGSEFVARAPADGYTVLMAITAMIQAPALNPRLPYDPFKDFVPISQVGYSQTLLMVPTTLKANNMKEFVALAKGGPKGLSFASFGNGTSPHLYGELLNMRAGVGMVHVPYKGASLALTDLSSGQVDAAFIDMGSARPQLAGGKLKALAISGTQRASFLPDVPTLAESGYSGFELNGWFGLFMPAGTPPDIARKFASEAARIVKLPEVAERLTGLGITPLGSSPEEFAAMLRTDAPKWAKIVKDANIKLD